jgi:hypothetical protein
MTVVVGTIHWLSFSINHNNPRRFQVIILEVSEKRMRHSHGFDTATCNFEFSARRFQATAAAIHRCFKHLHQFNDGEFFRSTEVLETFLY